MTRNWVLICLSIVIIFTVGTLVFFLWLPIEMITISNFIAYTSSLSTVIMVIIYLFTYYQQLNVMQNQLKEMKFSRNVEIQPLPYLEEPKGEMSLSRFFQIYETDFKKIGLMCRFFSEFEVTNIGNGPAVTIDFIPKFYEKIPNNQGDSPLIESMGKRIECISLREGDSQKISFLSFDPDVKVVEKLLQKHVVLLFVKIVYKNSLGMAFKENVGFWVSVAREHEDKIKSCLKINKTAEIDFGKKVRV